MQITNSGAIEIVQITDIHLSADENSNLKGVNTAVNLTRVLNEIKKTSYERLIVTGDISEDSSSASYHLFLNLLKQNHMSSVVCLGGNHDDPVVMNQVLKPFTLPQIFLVGNWLFIGLNTTLPGKDEGEISSQDMKMLEELLSTYNSSYVTLFMHHHSIPIKSEWIDRYRLRNASSLMSLLSKHNKVRAVISGHVHQETEIEHNGIAFYTTPATSFQFMRYSSNAKISISSPAWRKWYFWPNGRITNQLYYL